MTSKLEKYPGLAKAHEAKKKKATEKKLAAEEKKRAEEALKVAAEQVENNSATESESEDEVDVAGYLSELVNQQLQVAYKEVIKPKIKKQIKKRTAAPADLAPPVPTPVSTPEPVQPVRKSIFD